VSGEAVAREWQSVLRDVRAAVLAVPSRYGATMPHLGPNDIAALDREIRGALEGLADGSD
jgi:phage terminase Nu1 subunit (DNA packaging protein)